MLALKANPNIIEVLYSPLIERAEPAAQALISIRDGLLSRLIYQTFGGYVLAQFRKLERSGEKHGAPNWKNAMHLLRLLELGARILETGTVVLQTQLREELLEVRGGHWSLERIHAKHAVLRTRFEAAYKATSLPEHPNYAAVNDYLIQARRGAFGGQA